MSDSHAFGTPGPGIWSYDLDSGEGGLWFDGTMNFANGCALTPDGDALLVCETFGRQVTRIPILPDGRAGEATSFADDLPGVPDGLAIADDGTVLVGCYEPSRILRVPATGGRAEVYIEDPTAHLFRPPDQHRLRRARALHGQSRPLAHYPGRHGPIRSVARGRHAGGSRMKPRFLGLTWDHPRGFNALAAAAREIAPAGLIGWDKQPLEGFESHPIGDLAARYDVLVLDHPHIGEAVALDCLQPLEDLFTTDEIAAWGAASVGPTLASYKWEGRHWALPLDVATQVMAYRPDLIESSPRSWTDVLALSQRQPVAVSIAGPHAALCFQSLCVAFGEAPGGENFVGDAVAAEALDVLKRLSSARPPEPASSTRSGCFQPWPRGTASPACPSSTAM